MRAMNKLLGVCLLLILFTQLNSFVFAEEKIAVVKSREAVKQYDRALEGFSTALRAKMQLEYYVMTDYNANGRDLADKLSQSKARLILAIGTEALEYCSANIKDTPIIYCMVFKPTVSENNVTGVLMQVPYRNQFKIMKEIMPSLRKIGVLYDPEYNKINIEEAERAAQEEGLSLIAGEVDSFKMISSEFNKVIRAVDFFWMMPDATVCNKYSIQDILLKSIESSVPLAAFSAAYVKAGALVSLAADYYDLGAQAAEIGLRILSGESPAGINPVSPRREEIFVNLHTAGIIGLNIPKYIIEKAAQVFE